MTDWTGWLALGTSIVALAVSIYCYVEGKKYQ